MHASSKKCKERKRIKIGSAKRWSKNRPSNNRSRCRNARGWNSNSPDSSKGWFSNELARNANNNFSSASRNNVSRCRCDTINKRSGCNSVNNEKYSDRLQGSPRSRLILENRTATKERFRKSA